MTLSRISVVIPLYNKAAYVAEALTALLNQLKIGDELIVVDDCSTDDGPAIAQELLGSASGTQLVHLARNSGPASARNAGARVASGSHLLFFDADDVPSPKLLDSLRNAISQHPDDFVFSYEIAFQARGDSWTDLGAGVACTFQRRCRHAFVEDYLKGRTLCTASSTCVNRLTFFEVGGFQEGLRYCEDPDLWVRLSAQYDIISVKNVLALYRDVPQSLSYEWRGRIGSVNPYVDSLLELDRQYGGGYKYVSRSLLFKNVVFSRAAGARLGDVVRQLNAYRVVLGEFYYFALRTLNLVPSGVLMRLLKTNARRRMRRVSSAIHGVFL